MGDSKMVAEEVEAILTCSQDQTGVTNKIQINHSE